jgi:hypothetical protein
MNRNLIALAVMAAGIGLGVAVAPSAQADENSFLDAVQNAGIPLTDQKALTLGRATCGDLANGIDMSAILASNNPSAGSGPRMTSAQNWALFSAAVSELCPQMQSGY